jgi:HAD superfamily hydrolase (TIGR01509 family)
MLRAGSNSRHLDRVPSLVQFDAIIFDCDGVLVDSEVLGNQVLAEVMTEHGVPMTTTDSIRTFMGRSMGGIVEKATELAGRDMRAVCDSVFMPRLTEAFGDRLRAIEGIDRLLSGLRSPRAVASSSPTARLHRSLEVTGLLRHFGGHVYSVDLVQRPKPAPDVFLLAAERLGVPPASCVVVEDSPGGVTAAVAAGMRCVGFTAGGHCGDGHGDRLLSAGADRVACSAAELERLFTAAAASR